MRNTGLDETQTGIKIARKNISNLRYAEDFPSGSDGKASAYNVGDQGLIPGSGNGNPLQYSCLENPIDGGAW